VAFGNPEFATAGERSKGAILDSSDADTPLRGLGVVVGSMPFTPLPATAREIDAVARIYPAAAVRTFSGRAATEEAFKGTNLREVAVLHVATHAFVDPRVLERSAIVLAQDPDPAEDGLLTVSEILGLRFGSSAVVLSACQTAGEHVVDGEGLQGLARSFLAAGARAVVATLWSVPDESTADFMEHFHRALAGGATLADALQRARLALLRSGNPASSDASSWAAFVLVGDGRYAPGRGLDGPSGNAK
jgi:CHAT domain-containing protein